MEWKTIRTTDIADALSLKQSKSGNFHCFNSVGHKNNDQNASLSISDQQNGGFKCFACGLHGNNVELVKQVLNTDFRGVMHYLNEHFGNKTRYHVRFINQSVQRYQHIEFESSQLREPIDWDCDRIRETLNKKYSVETLQAAKVKISDKPYSLVFTGTDTYNPNNHNRYLHLEGRTDFLSAIEMGLDKQFALSLRFNKQSKIELKEGTSHCFILDGDDEPENLIGRIIGNNGNCSFLYPPGGHKDLSDYFNNGNTTLDVIELAQPLPAPDNAQVEQSGPEIQFFTANELQKMDVPPIEFLIDGFLPESGYYLLTGRPKSGKTTLMHYVLTCLSEGWPVFGKIATAPTKVLFLSLEDNNERMSRRFEQIYGAEAVKMQWSNNFIYATQFVRAQNGGLEHLTQTVERFDPAIICIDTLERFYSQGEQKGYSEDYKRIEHIQNATKHLNKCFLFLHHNRKMSSENKVDLISGTYGLSGAVDGYWILDKKPDQLNLYIDGRDVLENSYQLEHDKLRSTFQIIGKHHFEAKSFRQDQILNLLENSGYGLTRAEIATNLNIKENTARIQLYRMEKKRIVKKEKDRYTVCNTVTDNQQTLDMQGLNPVTGGM